MSELAEPRLGSDFATRVLVAVDRRRRQSRRFRWLAAVSFFFCAVTSLGIWRGTVLSTPAGREESAWALATPRKPNTNTRDSTETRDGADDPLSYMFPDAQPLARYASEEEDMDDSNAGTLFDDQE